MSRQEVMHDMVVEELERHFSGKASKAFYDHLDACASCMAAVAEMDDISVRLHELRPSPDSVPEPSIGFYNRVAVKIIDHQQKEAWGLFSPGAVFFRRVAFASLLLLAGLGSFLVTQDSDRGRDAAAIIAAHDPTGTHSEGSDRDRLLVTLADYRQ